MSPTVVKSLDGCTCGKVRTSRSTGSDVSARRGKRSPGSDIRVVVVCEEHFARGLEVRRPVLGLTVGSHHAVIAADAEVVLRRDSTRVVEGLLAGEDHGAVRRHDQNALGVHQHRGFGIPVRLRADVDSGDDDVDLTAVLGEGDDSPQRARHPVHVLGAALHRNRGAGGQGEPLDRHGQLLGEIERRDDPSALGFGDRAQRLRRVAEQRDACHPLGVAGCRPRHHDRRSRPAVLRPYGRSTGTSVPDSSRSYSTNCLRRR